jgi:hypothetical protein
MGDRYGGEWPRERFRSHGIAYEPATQSKSDLYRELLPQVNAGRVDLLDDRRLAAQLCSLERRSGSSGRDTIDHPPGGRDDLANAVAGAIVRASGRTVWNLDGLYVAHRSLATIDTSPWLTHAPASVHPRAPLPMNLMIPASEKFGDAWASSPWGDLREELGLED